MNPSRTLADRFRTQRTDRIRVDGNEVVSLLEADLPVGASVEIVVESRRTGTPQGVALRADQPLGPVSSTPTLPDTPQTPATDTIIDASVFDMVEFAAGGDDVADLRLQLWNTWSIDGDEQAWTGNSGMIIDELDPPAGAIRQLRLWCSDGLGDPSFDDLVVIVTVASPETDD